MKLPSAPTIKIPALTLSKREMFLVTLFLLVSLGILYNRFVWEPQWNNGTKIRAEVEQKRKDLNLRISQEWNNIPGLKAQSQEIRERINKIYLTVPNIKDEPGLLVDFYNLARLNIVQAQTIKFSEMKEVKDKYYSTFDISLEVTGYNADIYNFIEALEKYPRLNRISEIAFKPLSSVESTCTIMVEFYVLHEVQPDPATYPFMEGLYGKAVPYRIFDVYVEEEQAEPVPLPSYTGAPALVPVPAQASAHESEQLSIPKNDISGKQETKEPPTSSEAAKDKTSVPRFLIIPRFPFLPPWFSIIPSSGGNGQGNK